MGMEEFTGLEETAHSGTRLQVELPAFLTRLVDAFDSGDGTTRDHCCPFRVLNIDRKT
jgi:hypothetical protein